jgi:hypothetical protein
VIFGANKIKLLIIKTSSVIPFKIKSDPPFPLPHGSPQIPLVMARKRRTRTTNVMVFWLYAYIF